MEEVEYIDVYDIHHEPTGLVMPRKHLALKSGQYMLYVLAILEDPEHRFLITRRSLTKKWAAGAWEVPGGGVKKGETSKEALIREVHEETSLDVSRSSVIRSGAMSMMIRKEETIISSISIICICRFRKNPSACRSLKRLTGSWRREQRSMR